MSGLRAAARMKPVIVVKSAAGEVGAAGHCSPTWRGSGSCTPISHRPSLTAGGVPCSPTSPE